MNLKNSRLFLFLLIFILFSSLFGFFLLWELLQNRLNKQGSDDKIYINKGYQTDDILILSNVSLVNNQSPIQFVSPPINIQAHKVPRILIFSSDNRFPNEGSGYLDLNVYVNSEYARKYKYDYLYIQQEYTAPISNQPTTDMKNRYQCYNEVLKQYRSSSWCKLQAFYYVYTTLQQKYDYYLMVDTDSMIIRPDIDFLDFLSQVNLHTNIWGTSHTSCSLLSEDINSCFIGFWSDKPYNEEILPCAGQVILRRSSVSELFLQAWWHGNDPDFNAEHSFEQMMLHHLLQKEKSVKDNPFLMKNFFYNISMLNESSFGFDFHVPNTGQFLAHIGSMHQAQREPAFREHAIKFYETNKQELDGRFKTDSFDSHLQAVIQDLIKNKTIKLNLDKDRIPFPAEERAIWKKQKQ